MKIDVEPNTRIAVVFKASAFIPSMDPKTGHVQNVLNVIQGLYRPDGDDGGYTLSSPTGDGSHVRWHGDTSDLLLWANLEEKVLG